MNEQIIKSSFLSNFKYKAYSKSQIGYNPQIINSLYDYLARLNLPNKSITIIINNLAYFLTNDLNLPLYLELLSKSLGFINSYRLQDIIKTVYELHNIYYPGAKKISLEEYFHSSKEQQIKKIFLRHHRYIYRDFSNHLGFLNDLKLASAINLDTKTYQDFMNVIDNFTTNIENYSPLLTFKIYLKIRNNLKNVSKLFWDIFFGNEYIVCFYKYKLKINDIYSPNIISFKDYNLSKEPIQLDLFTYLDYTEEPFIDDTITEFQISTIYHSYALPDFNTEKDLLAYYEKLLTNKENIQLPKLKSSSSTSYQYEIKLK